MKKLLITPYENKRSDFINNLKKLLIESNISFFDMKQDRATYKKMKSMQYGLEPEFSLALDLNIPFILKNTEENYSNDTCSIWNTQTNELNTIHKDELVSFISTF